MKSNSVWFSVKRYGLVTGITILVGIIGAISATGPLAIALEKYSWQSIFVVIGILSLLFGIFAVFFVRNSPTKHEVEHFLKEKRKIIHQDRHWIKDFFILIKKKQIWACFFINLGTVGSLYSIMGLWAIPYLRDVFFLSNAQASKYVIFMMAAFGAGTLVIGLISDKLGRRKPLLVFGNIFYFLMWLVVMFFPLKTGLLCLGIFTLMGFFSSVIVLSFPCCKEIVPSNMTGMALGIANIGAFLGVSIIQPLFGLILDLSRSGDIINKVHIYSAGDYHNAFYMVSAFAFVGIIGALMIKETFCKNIITHEEYS